MANPSGPGAPASVAHRSVASIRTAAVTAPSSSAGGAAGAAPASPATPLRSGTLASGSAFGSPAGLRADEDTLVLEFGTRVLRVGLAGDALPKAVLSGFGSAGQGRRAGDFRVWAPDYRDEWWRRGRGAWGREYELWRPDVRRLALQGEEARDVDGDADQDLDLDLLGDRLEQALREAFAKYLLLDSRGRRAVAVLPSGVPTPVLSTILDTLAGRFQCPTVSLVAAPVMVAVAAGVRSALVVDLGWHETVVSGVFEYREVLSRRSVRAGRMLVEHVHKLLRRALAESRGEKSSSTGEGADNGTEAEEEHVVSFEECEDITRRMAWCKPIAGSEPDRATGLSTVHEDEPEDATNATQTAQTIPLASTTPPTTLHLTHAQLATPCEDTFLVPQFAPAAFDAHEQPLPALIYHALLDLPLDVRAACMARVIFVGGAAGVLGLRGRLLAEVDRLVRDRGWERVQGRAAEQVRANAKLRQAQSAAAAANGGDNAADVNSQGREQDGVWHDASASAATAAPEDDPVERQMQQRRGGPPPPDPVLGELRAVESLGAWAGASLLAQLRVPVVATVDRELWLQHGAAGAGRAGEVDVVAVSKAQQRQSLGGGMGGLVRAAAGGAGGAGGAGAAAASWTLGAWGPS